MDDITLASKDSGIINQFVEELQKHLKLRDLGSTNYLLSMGIRCNQKEQKLWLSSKQYILQKLEEFGMSDCKPIGTPMNPGLRLTRKDCPTTEEAIADMADVERVRVVYGTKLILK